MATKVEERVGSLSDSELKSDYDEEPAFKMKDTEKVVSLAICTRLSRYTRPFFICVIVGTAIVGFLKWQEITTAIQRVIEFWVNNPGHGFLIFLLIHLLCAILKLPMVELVLACGYVGARTFGPIGGIFVGACEAFLASLISSSVEFVIGRYFCLRRVQTWVMQSRKLNTVAGLLQSNGFKVVVMIRLASLVPFGTANYLLAAMNVTFKNYTLGSVGLLPYIFTYVTLGGSISSIADVANGRTGSGLTSLIIIMTSAVLTLAISIYISIWTRRALGKLENQERRRSVTIRRNSQIQLMALQQMANQSDNKRASTSDDAANIYGLVP